MVTFKSVKIFIENGIAYFGIPEDLIIHFLEQAIGGKEKAKFDHRKEILTKLGLFASAQSEIDMIMASKIETTIIEMIVESERPLTKRAQWVLHSIKLDKLQNAYHFTVENLLDLNKRLKIEYRLAWVYKILSLRHSQIREGFVKTSNGKRTRRMACIDIPKYVVDKIINKSGQIDVLPSQEPINVPTIMKENDNTPEDSAEEMVEEESGSAGGTIAVQEQSNEPVQVESKSNFVLSKENQQIAEMVLLIVEREERIEMQFLKAKIERTMEVESIDWELFTRIIEHLHKTQMITVIGNLIKSVR